MAEHRQRDEWSRTSCVMALVANTQRNPSKTRPFRPGDFDPFAAASDRRAQAVPVSALKDAFIKAGVRDRGSGSGIRD